MNLWYIRNYKINVWRQKEEKLIIMTDNLHGTEKREDIKKVGGKDEGEESVRSVS